MTRIDIDAWEKEVREKLSKRLALAKAALGAISAELNSPAKERPTSLPAEIIDYLFDDVGVLDLVYILNRVHSDLHDLPTRPKTSIVLVEDILFAILPIAYFRKDDEGRRRVEGAEFSEEKRAAAKGREKFKPVSADHYLAYVVEVMSARLDRRPVSLSFAEKGKSGRRLVGEAAFAPHDVAIKEDVMVVDLLEHLTKICGLSEWPRKSLQNAYEKRGKAWTDLLDEIDTEISWRGDSENPKRMTPYLAYECRAGDTKTRRTWEKRLDSVRLLWRSIRIFEIPEVKRKAVTDKILMPLTDMIRRGRAKRSDT